jgi:hypothetical protein
LFIDTKIQFSFLQYRQYSSQYIDTPDGIAESI